MKKIYESPLCGWDESATIVHIFELESDEEYFKLEAMNHAEMLDYFGVTELTGYAVAPGGMGYTYYFHVSWNHVIMYEHRTLNV